MIYRSPTTGLKFIYLDRVDAKSKSGRPVQIDLWRGECRKCGSPFDVSTPAQRGRPPRPAFASGDPNPSLKLVHCPKHRLSRKQAMAEARKHRDLDALRERFAEGRRKANARRAEEAAIRRLIEPKPKRAPTDAARAALKRYLKKRKAKRVADSVGDSAILDTYFGLRRYPTGTPLEQVIEIENLLEQGLPSSVIGADLGMSTAAVASIGTGRTHGLSRAARGAMGQLLSGVDRVHALSRDSMPGERMDALKGLVKLEQIGAVAVSPRGAIQHGVRWARVLRMYNER